MAVAELVSQRRFALREQELPSPPPGHVQVRVEAVGICGSDLHYFSEGSIGDTVCKYPQVLGHEPSGTILTCGDGVSGWTPGDRAALEPPLYCYHCEMCMSGRHNLCLHGDFMSSPTAPGFFRDRVNIPVANLLPLPANLGFAEATLYEPISIVLHSFRFADPKLGEDVAVFGAGPIGLATIACVRLAGVRRIWAVEPVKHRRELAKELGADVVIDPAEADPVQEIRRDTGRGVHLTIDCATKQDTINQSLRSTRPGGRVCITGVPSEVRIPFEFHTMRSKELGFHVVRRSNHVSDRALELLSAESRRFTPMISHRMMLDDIQRAFETLERYEDGANKMVLYPR